MPSTTIHIPDNLLAKIDEMAKQEHISRNRLIVRACEQILDNIAGQWPERFFEPEMSEGDLKLLRQSVLEMEDAIIRMRRNRKRVDL